MAVNLTTMIHSLVEEQCDRVRRVIVDANAEIETKIKWAAQMFQESDEELRRVLQSLADTKVNFLFDVTFERAFGIAFKSLMKTKSSETKELSIEREEASEKSEGEDDF